MIQNIINSVEELITKYDERNPFKLCKYLDIEIIPYNFTKNFKGYQVEIDGIKMIIINENLSGVLKKFVCAHELAHFVLHDYLSNFATRTFNVSDITGKPELHANYFASELILSDEDFLFELKDCDNYYTLSKKLNVLPEILDFKVRIMQFKGYNINSFLNIRGDFLEKYIPAK